jgi:cobyrinic acid a,c-diamide synthase
LKGLLIAGTNSGVGKTTVSLALMRALTRQGLTVQPFKVGPDFIDPGHHALATGRTSENLDGWMLAPEKNLDIFSRCAQGVEVAVVEGVMGLYDGFGPLTDEGSTAQMAKMLGLPVLLVAKAKGMGRSLAALVQGFTGFDPDLTWAGVLANRVGSPGHAELLRKSLGPTPKAPLLGGLPHHPEITMPERHLGLITAEEGGLSQAALNRLADWLESTVDLKALWERLPEITLNPSAPDPKKVKDEPRVRLGIARDQAFCFYYAENLRLLEQAGAELVFFSPLQDHGLPPGLDGLFLGGGYPELFAEQLAGNTQMLADILAWGRAGMPIYAECGGLMYLGRELDRGKGRPLPMVGYLPFRTKMLSKLAALGYREVTFRADTPLGPSGTSLRGHEFHYSELEWPDTALELNDHVYKVSGRKGTPPDTCGYLLGNTLASYVHLHFASNPGVAQNFVNFCDRK